MYNSNGADKQIDENVPKTNPYKIGKLKSNMTFPPNAHKTANEMNDVNAVKIVLDRVSFILLFNTSTNVILFNFRRFSLILSYMTTLS